jgi:hypothetical protein
MIEQEIATLSKWADTGATEGDPSDLPASPRFESGWQIGKPDIVFSLQNEVDVPASGTIAYQNHTVETNFTEDKWIQPPRSARHRAVVHHIIVFVQEPGATGCENCPASHRASTEDRLTASPSASGRFRLIFRMHYTTNGAARTALTSE